MFFDSWHKDSFLPLPPEEMRQSHSNWISPLVVIALIGIVVSVILKSIQRSLL